MTTTVVVLLDCLRAHLTAFELPQLGSVYVTRYGPHVTAQLAWRTFPQIASGLLAWADTLTDVTAEAWRVPGGHSVHLSVIGQLPGGAWVRVYGVLPPAEHGIGADLAPNACTTVALAVLRELATVGR
jgi:hypothetical protein